MGRYNRARFLPLWLLVAVCLAQPAQTETADPWQGVNRRVFDFNDWADARVLRPTAVAYERGIPQPLRGAGNTLFDNIAIPGFALNQLLQAKLVRFISPAIARTGVVAVSVVDRRTGLLGVDDLVVGERYLFFKDAYDQRRAYLIPDGVLDDDLFAGDGFGEDSDF